MPELTDELVRKIEETHDKVIDMAATIGNGKRGLCEDIRQHNKRLWWLDGRTRRLEIVLAFLFGSGIITGGTIGLINWLG